VTFRRAALALSGALAVVVAWGCRRESSCESRSCGTAVVVTSAEADALFPPLSTSDVGVGLGDLIFAKLADVGPSLNTVGDSGFVPVLARAWRFEDSLTLSLTLRPEARWHDGAPVSAEDVAFTFDVYQDSLVNSPTRPRLAELTSVTARNPHTVVIRFRRAYAEAFFDAVYHMRILPRHLLDSIPRGRLASHPFGRSPVGSGPYRFVRWKAGEFVELAADSSFFLGRPGIRRLIWRFAGDPFTAVTQLVAGDADIMHALGGPENVRRVASAAQVRLVEYPLTAYGFVAFNLRDPRAPDRPHPLFADRELRRALSMAVDRGVLVRAVLGEYGRVPVGPVSRALWISSDDVEQIPFDTGAARRALTELGWRDSNGDGVVDRAGRSLAFDLLVPSTSSVRHGAALILQEQLRRVGVAVTLREQEFNVFMSRAAAGRFDAYFGMWAQDPSPASILETWTAAGLGHSNFGSYASPAFDSLVHAAVRAPDPAAARGRWRAALSRINADAPALWLLAPTGVAGVHRRFDNVSIRPDQWTADLWTWRVAPASR